MGIGAEFPSCCGAEPAEEKPSQNDPVDFARQIAPILEQHCLRCHHPENRRGDISLASAEDVVGLGYVSAHQPDESYLLELVSPADGKGPRMPKEGAALVAEQVALLRRWIAEGAVWPKEIVLKQRAKADAQWWAFQTLQTADPPPSEQAPPAWQPSLIDRFVLAKLTAAGLSPSPPAARRELIRRVTYDLTGLPPTPEETAAFVGDAAPNAYETLVDRLLASPRYGERWGRHWLDVVRFGESNGFERNVTIDNLWPFRDYVIRSLNDDKPFDQLLREHLAGDVLARKIEATQPTANTTDVELGAAFLVAGPYDDVGNQDAVQAAQIRADTIDEMIRATSEAFLGLTLGCARCHDHKFDPLLQADYYSFYATFAGVKHGARVLGSAAQREALRLSTEPLVERIKTLREKHERLQRELQMRAEAGAAATEARWKRPAVSRQQTEDAFPPVEARYVRLTVLATDDNPASTDGYRIDEFEVWTAEEKPRNAALSAGGAMAEGKSRGSGTFTEEYEAQLVIDGKFGARWLAAEPRLLITLPKVERINRIVFSSDRQAELDRDIKTMFVGEYLIEISLDGEHWTRVAGSEDRRPATPQHRAARLMALAQALPENQPLQAELAQTAGELAAARRRHAELQPLPMVWLGQISPAPGPFQIFLGGDPQRKGRTIEPASLSVLRERFPGYQLAAQSDEAERRLALAEWISHPQNPLTPRVLANRLWHYHFGRGIVDTPSDFGYMGSRPTHPELLDWLAGQVLASGWKLKPLHKLIVMSQAYQQSAAPRDEALKIDADSRLLWRYPPRRLSAEEVRDTVLQVAGKLDLKMGGPGFRLYQYLQDNVATYVPLDKHGPETYRRAVYHHNARAAPVDVLSDFDSPDCAFAAPRRAATTTPMQALTMLNHSFTVEMAEFLSQRMKQEAGEDPAAQIQRAYQLLFQRPPSEAELAKCRALVDQHGTRALCRVLLNTSELVYLE